MGAEKNWKGEGKRKEFRRGKKKMEGGKSLQRKGKKCLNSQLTACCLKSRVSHTIIKSEPECGFAHSAKEVLEWV